MIIIIAILIFSLIIIFHELGHFSAGKSKPYYGDGVCRRNGSDFVKDNQRGDNVCIETAAFRRFLFHAR